MIQTANDDKMNSSLNFNFNICSYADIYIAYDHQLADRVLGWITNDYSKINGEEILATGYSPTDITTFDIWKRRSDIIGQISFGSNNGIAESSMYFVFYKIKALNAKIKVFLQGPYNTANHNMNTNLINLPGFPKTQPYGGAPWNYTGTEDVLTIPSDIVDWVLVRLRSGSNPSTATTIAQRAAFLKSDGQIVNLDGSNPVSFNGISPGEYYIVLKHRNHLAVMSSDAVELNGLTTYDFTTSESQAYIKTVGSIPMADLGGGKYGMWAGDVSGNGILKYNLSNNDRDLILQKIGGSNINATVDGYFGEDVNMDGTVKYNLSKNDRDIILVNIGGANINAIRTTQVP